MHPSFLHRNAHPEQSGFTMVEVLVALVVLSIGLLGIAAGILEGEIQRMAGDVGGAVASFQRAADLQAALVYDEPEPLPFSAFHWLGAALVDARRYAEAEKAYRVELKDHPHNGWSLLGLKLAIEGQGQEPSDVAADLASSWSRADTWIQSSRF